MKKKLVVVLLTAAMSMSLLAGCGGNSGSSDAKSDAKTEDTKEDSDQVAADKVAKLIDETLAHYLSEKVFAGNKGTSMDPDPEDVKGFETFIERYKKGIAIEKAALENLIV